MAEEDNFDIDIYGDEAGHDEYAGEQAAEGATDENITYDNQYEDENRHNDAAEETHADEIKTESTPAESSSTVKAEPAPLPQGTKRKGSMDERQADPNATNAVLINELHWWITEDEVRGWCNQAGCEEDMRDLTFNEHKVNGKSKGQVHLEFNSAAASTALKHYLDNLKPQKADPKMPIATYHLGGVNPYKTLPKDVQARRNETRGTNDNPRSYGGQSQGYSERGNFRGRGNFGNRGGMNIGGGGYQRGGFQGGMPNMGAIPNMAGGNMGMGGFSNMAGGFNNNFNRGGMMGGGMRGGMAPNRGGRGGMGAPMMGQMGGMGAMNMGAMPMGGMGAMGMGGGMIGMGGGFQNQAHFNPAFFQGQNAGGAGDWGNPHGAKRPRPNE